MKLVKQPHELKLVELGAPVLKAKSLQLKHSFAEIVILIDGSQAQIPEGFKI